MTAITLTYTGDTRSRALGLVLEQEPVDDGLLTLDDLERMLALVRSGISARTYSPAACPATVVGGEIEVVLHVWVWPRPLDLPYTLAVSLGTVAEGMQVQVEREFEVVIPFERLVDLPFLTDGLTFSWSDLPCFDRRSAEVERPPVIVEPGRLRIGAEVLGVGRVHGLALGRLHTITLRLPKGTSKISDVRPVVTAAWDGIEERQGASLPLTLPGCVTQMLAACDDGELIPARRGSRVQTEEVERVPTVYYSACNGSVLDLRYERPR